MPLPPAAPRRRLHTRHVHCEAFLRDDGLWEIEGHMVDAKTYAYREAFRGMMEPGRPVHDMWLRVTLDDRLVIHDIAAAMDAAPYTPCQTVPPDYAKLKGLRIGPGWKARVKGLVGRTHGCTHLFELLDPVATVAHQTIVAGKRPEENEPPTRFAATAKPPFFLDGCRSWSRSSPVVRALLPQFYDGPAAESEAGEPVK